MGVIADAGYWRSGKRRALLTHRNAGMEIVCVTSGRAVWHVDGHKHQVPPGSVFFTWPWEWHGGVQDTEPGLELWYVMIRLDRAYRRQPKVFDWHRDIHLPPSAARSIRKTLLACDTRALPLTERILWLVRTLVQETQLNIALKHTMAGALATAATIELAREVDRRHSGEPTQRRGEATKRVADFVDRLTAKCYEPWSVATMATACSLSRSRFTELVRTQTGDPPLLLLNRLRVQRAQRLLRESNRSVIDIALSCGFSSSQYFCRVFGDYTGQTPTHFRQS